MGVRMMTEAELCERGEVLYVEELTKLGAWEDIVAICARHGVADPRELRRSTRLMPVTSARHDAWLYLRARFGWSYPYLGRLFDRDHTTVLQGIRKATARRDRMAAEALPDPFARRLAALRSGGKGAA